MSVPRARGFVSMEIDALDRELLNLLQTEFPVASRPYMMLAERLCTSEEDIMQRLRRLSGLGVIRRIGGVFDSRALGYLGTLCAMKVPADKIEEVAAVVNGYPGVTHNYLRDHDYNMWFTVLAESEQRIRSILDEIRRATGIDDLMDLPARRVFKIKVTFDAEA
ncbi:MAG: AsnC family transcriptional regulator [Bacillota bacterium]